MGEPGLEIEQARAAAREQSWAEVDRLLRGQGEVRLTGHDLALLADATWWLCQVEESLAIRQRAYAALVADGDARAAGYQAWLLSTEYHLLARRTLSAGWLAKARRHLRDDPSSIEYGYLLFTEVEIAEYRGERTRAVELAQRIIEIGERWADADVLALGRLAQGRLLVAVGAGDDGFALLDEVMCDVTAGALDPMVTGWVYCMAVAVCFDVADLRRATEWNDAAMSWCASLSTGTPFHGLCRVHRVELLGLGGDWVKADLEADQACGDLLAYDPSMAGESFYVAGEIRRRMGDLAAAERAFLRAHELGREPQPGLALLRLAQGRPEAAGAAVRACLGGSSRSPLERARLLDALIEVQLATADVDGARVTVAELAVVADASGAGLLAAMAAAATGAVHLADRHPQEALTQLRRARDLWVGLQLPYETARTRVLLAAASREVGDGETARLELRAAAATFERLGSSDDLRRVRELLADEPSATANLTGREVEVLRLLAAGKTNRQIAAELVVSQHTIARHCNNIFAKIGVSSRAAATAFAYTHDLVSPAASSSSP